jgi:hypothetical protein
MPTGTIIGMNPDTLYIWRSTRRGPWRWRLRMRVALVLYVIGLHRAAMVAGK